MRTINVVVASLDSRVASRLAASLNHYFRNVSVAGSLDEVRHAIPKHRAHLAVLDLEMAPVEEVGRLAHEFQNTNIVCTHRIPDEEMWTSALAAGAIDCCPSDDAAGIVNAVDRYVRLAHSHAA
jgi:hypothetical protein